MLTPKLLSDLDRPVPRYTSYPTAPQFVSVDESLFLEQVAAFQTTDRPLSLYIHIPFCRSMCLFCACSVVLNRREDVQERYFAALLQEISLVQSKLGSKRRITQLHLGGGTPTQLTCAQLTTLVNHLRTHFQIASDAELSIEVDPRTVFEDHGEKLTLLHSLGFHRISFGVQDLDPKVQEAVKRRQTEEMTHLTYRQARLFGFKSINIDLIYGLPLQTQSSFAYTIDQILAWRPDRVALFSYAHVPWLKAHQKAIPAASFPSTEEKFAIYLIAREKFCAAGYHPIGMDHFALPEDSLTLAHKGKRLTRNFQGYSLALAEDSLGFGITSIGFLNNCYFQNEKTLDGYYSHLDHQRLPIARGFALSSEDLVRRFVIQSLMCHFELDKQAFYSQFQLDFDTHFQPLQPQLQALSQQGLLRVTSNKLEATSLGALFVRLLAAPFDAYLQKGQFSKAI